MDAGRYMLQQPGWDSNSALESYNAVHDPEFRLGGAYRGRGFVEGGFPRESSYIRGAYHRDILLEREGFQLGPPALGLWPPPRRRTLEEELAIIRGAQRHDKVSYVDSFREIGSYREMDTFRETERFRDSGNYRDIESYRDIDTFRDNDRFRDYGYERVNMFPSQERESYEVDDYDYKHRILRGSREGSLDDDFDYHRHDDHESDHEHGRRDRDGRKQRERGRERRGKSRNRDRSPARDNRQERSRSRSHDDRGWRSDSRSRSRGKQGDSQEEARHESRSEKSEKKRDRDEKRHHGRAPVSPSATVVVKGLSQKTVEDDLCQALTEWGPLRHVRVIKERNSGVSRGFAFIDFPSVEAAQKMMDALGEEGLVIDGRRLFFEYSSKPTGGLGAPQAVPVGAARGSTPGTSKNSTAAAIDWMCTVCGCVNFARRTSCFQCNEGRAEDAPAADVSASTPTPAGKKGSEAAPTHVLVVRGLDEHVNEETLHFEFSKYAPIKDLRLVRDKFTHVSRGFAFIHFHSVEDATKALDSSNGTTLEKNGQVLRVAYAKSIHGPGSASANPAASQNNSLAAAAIEAATFAQQYDIAGWAPKEYNPEKESGGIQQGMDRVALGAQDTTGVGGNGDSQFNNGIEGNSAAPQAGFVWDEASGYYYDATSGFYYDGHRGLYYDGNHGVWYSYDQETQQYVPYVESSITRTAADSSKTTNGFNNGMVEKSLEKSAEVSSNSKAVISAPPATIYVDHETAEKKPTNTKAVQAAAIVAQATVKKEREKTKEKEKELRLASKGLLLASKKKIGNVATMWKHRQHEFRATPMPIDAGPSTATKEDKREVLPVITTSVSTPVQTIAGTKKIEGVIHTRGSLSRGTISLGRGAGTPVGGNFHPSESVLKTGEKSNGTGISVSGVIKGGVGRGEHVTFVQPSLTAESSLNSTLFKTKSGVGRGEQTSFVQPSLTHESSMTSTPFKTDASALGSYGPTTGARRRFTETPQSTYRDRAAERRSLYGSSLSSDVALDLEIKDKGACEGRDWNSGASASSSNRREGTAW